jgi:hypothetical protein
MHRRHASIEFRANRVEFRITNSESSERDGNKIRDNRFPDRSRILERLKTATLCRNALESTQPARVVSARRIQACVLASPRSPVNDHHMGGHEFPGVASLSGCELLTRRGVQLRALGQRIR